MSYQTDKAASDAASRLAAGRGVDVWKDLECISRMEPISSPRRGDKDVA
jgi:hypothetical protein